MIFTKASVKPSDTVVIFGIGGGVSLSASQLCKLAGAETIVVSRSEEKLRRALDLGADHGINLKAEDVSKRVMEITGGRGADVVVENVGEAVWLSALKSMARGGILVTCGATTGAAPPADLQRMFIRQLTVMGSTGGSHEELRQLLAVAKRGGIKPVIDSIVPMDEVRSALSRLESAEQFGKIALTIDGH